MEVDRGALGGKACHSDTSSEVRGKGQSVSAGWRVDGTCCSELKGGVSERSSWGSPHQLPPLTLPNTPSLVPSLTTEVAKTSFLQF